MQGGVSASPAPERQGPKMTAPDNPYAPAGAQYQPSVTMDGGDAGASAVKDTSTATFATDVVVESRRQPVLVDFWAPWCGPCKQLAPALEKAVKEAAGRVKLVKMNIDEHPAIAGQLGIQSIPAVIAFKNGQPVDGFMGAVPESQIKEFIDRVAGKGAGPRLGEMLEAAAKALEAGDQQQAAALFDAVLAEDPASAEAAAGLAGLLIDAGQSDEAEVLLNELPEDRQSAAPVAAIRARLALAAQAATLGDPGPLLQRLEKDPKDHQARFDLAMIQNGLGQRDEAAESLLTIVRSDRGWNDGAARAQLLQFFEAWGLMDEATLSARRKLSSILFS
jgi:putative thioredoxin